jgi:tRNA G10  N-methylase Trm11
LAAHYRVHGKESHQAALRSAEALGEQVATLARHRPIRTQVFQASAFDAQALMSQLGDTRADIVLTDVPYGRHSEWRVDHQDQAQNPVGAMLQALRGILHTGSIVAVISDKHQKIVEDDYVRVERFQMGKRQIMLLKPRL